MPAPARLPPASLTKLLDPYPGPTLFTRSPSITVSLALAFISASLLARDSSRLDYNLETGARFGDHECSKPAAIPQRCCSSQHHHHVIQTASPRVTKLNTNVTQQFAMHCTALQRRNKNNQKPRPIFSLWPMAADVG